MVRGIQEETGASIDIQEDGTIHVGAVSGTAMQAAKDMILGIVKEPEVGEVFEGEVVGIKDFGAFVKLTPGKDGLLHISRVANGRVGKVEDVLSLGDIVKVEVLEIDPKTGKISLDRLDKPDAPASSAPAPRDKGERHERRERREDNRPGRAGRTPRRRHEGATRYSDSLRQSSLCGTGHSVLFQSLRNSLGQNTPYLLYTLTLLLYNSVYSSC